MKANGKVLAVAAVVGVVGVMALWPSHRDSDSTVRHTYFSFTHKVSDDDRKFLNSNLEKAFDSAPSGKTNFVVGNEKAGNPSLVAEIRDRASVEKFRDLELCLEARNPCDIPQTEPRSSDIFVTDQAVRELQGLRMAFSQLSPQDQESLRADLAPATQWALSNSDDNIREEGMYLARVVLPPEERVQSVIASLKESVSGPLYDIGLGILRENKDVLRREQEDFYVETMKTGGFYASEEVARQILPYLNDENIVRFVDLRSQLPAESSTATYLGDNIKEYRMISQGG